MEKYNLAKLNKVDLREIWKHEAYDLTNWLAEGENLRMLGEEVGISMILLDKEAKVGSFSVDILAEEEGTEEKIVIENQLESTNHDHLGKIITYASGYDAKYIIWLVKDAREEHSQAVTWLNQHTDNDLYFFLIKLEVWQIENSRPAPKFQVIVQPNEWAKTMRRSAMEGEIGPNQIFYLDFWSEFIKYGTFINTKLKLSHKPLARSWYDISLPNTGCHIAMSANLPEKRIRCMFYISDSDELYNYLFENKASIEKEFGSELEWNPSPDKKSNIIRISKSADLEVAAEKNNAFDWLIKQAEKIQQIFPKYVEEFNKQAGTN